MNTYEPVATVGYVEFEEEGLGYFTCNQDICAINAEDEEEHECAECHEIVGPREILCPACIGYFDSEVGQTDGEALDSESELESEPSFMDAEEYLDAHSGGILNSGEGQGEYA